MWFLMLLFIFSKPALAQDQATLFTKYQQDYLYQYDLYQQSYADYTGKKQIFVKYGTVTTQNEAFLAAKQAINARNQVLKTYLMALRVMLNDYKTSDFVQTESIQTDLSGWESWLDQQPAIVAAINNTKDLQTWVKVFQSKYIQIQRSIYTSLVLNEVNLRGLTLNQTQSLFQNIQNHPRIKPDSQQWIQSYSDKSNLASSAINNALLLTKKNQPTDRFSNFYPNAQTNLDQSRKYLTEITSDLKLIIIKFYQP